jgi:hypothetical protein
LQVTAAVRSGGREAYEASGRAETHEVTDRHRVLAIGELGDVGDCADRGPMPVDDLGERLVQLRRVLTCGLHAPPASFSGGFVEIHFAAGS